VQTFRIAGLLVAVSITFALLPLDAPCTGNATTIADPGSLRDWVGKNPTYDDNGKVLKTTFFMLPNVKPVLLHLLSREDFLLLTEEYRVESPIEECEGFLVISRCRPHNCPGEYAMLIIALSSGEVQVGLHKGEAHRCVESWYYSNDCGAFLPDSIDQEFTHYGVPPCSKKK
jgi:hypothetical protein